MGSRGSTSSRTRYQNQDRLAHTPNARPPRSKFDRSHGIKTTIDAGDLVPLYVDEMLPGDSFKGRFNIFGRLATPLHPFMDNLWLDTHTFAVPMRLLWTNFTKFFGERHNADDHISYNIPTTQAGGYSSGSLYDYMGIPPLGADTFVNALPFRAYVLIWEEFFRDRNLQDKYGFLDDDGPDPQGWYLVLKRGKRHDYFTSAQPVPAAGDPVTLPLGDFAPVVPDESAQAPLWKTVSNPALNLYASNDAQAWANWGATDGGGAEDEIATWVDPHLVADLSQAQAVSIADLRLAFQTQKLLERDQRGGQRFPELVYSHFNVLHPDQGYRPIFLGSGSQKININPVAQTVRGEDPLADLAAFGTTNGDGHTFSYTATEPCYIITLCSVRGDLNYSQGLNRMWSRKTRYDFYWPEFQSLSEQAVLNKEIYLSGGAGDPNVEDPDDWDSHIDNQVFGWQERHAEYRYKPSHITGLMRTDTAGGNLGSWHIAQHFDDLPVLGPDFIIEDPPVDRVLAVQNQPDLIIDAYLDLTCARPMPIAGIPGYTDHF